MQVNTKILIPAPAREVSFLEAQAGLHIHVIFPQVVWFCLSGTGVQGLTQPTDPTGKPSS